MHRYMTGDQAASYAGTSQHEEDEMFYDDWLQLEAARQLWEEDRWEEDR